MMRHCNCPVLLESGDNQQILEGNNEVMKGNKSRKQFADILLYFR